jgi:peptidoglycan/LPS O-acetylase OafA/YrhL
MLYFKKLDTLRFVAFFLVFWSHLFTKNFTLDWLTDSTTIQTIIRSFIYTGGIGVQIFFVISGFLITFLLIKENENTGKVNVMHFYFRRILRIWPLYYFVFATGIFILPNLIHTFHFEGSMWKNLCFLNNFDLAYKEQNIAVGWSVAIEEQFYLFWPLLFILLFKRNVLNIFCSIIYIGAIAFILKYPELAHFHTFGNLHFLMIGCLGASLYAKNSEKIGASMLTKKTFFYANLLCIIFMLIFANLYLTMGFLLWIIPINFLLIVIHLVTNNTDTRPTKISRLGKYTYGMYLYHPIFIILTKIGLDKLQMDHQNNLLVILGMAIVSLSLTIVCSVLSYRYFEKPFLQLKSKFTSIKTRI